MWASPPDQHHERQEAGQGRRRSRCDQDEQRIVLDHDFYLWDTPGMLWPRISIEQSGFNLAASGSIGRNAYDEELVALELLLILQSTMPRT